MHVKHGTTRIVLLIGSWAIKLPTNVEWRLFLKGLLANMLEARLGRSTDEPYCSKLCPVLFALPGGFMVVMKRCTPLSHFEYVKRLVELDDWPVLVEPKPDSFGLLDGRVVAIDYGN